ncbi:EAL domain-containing protein [Jiella sp. M17.18]|uniref:EAL domain-containing protein n=1 Tax=Jiella sp. M17.18 TaxID=3234247 RepID=UPI0034E051E2
MSIRLKLLLACLALTMMTAGLGVFAQNSQRDVGRLAERIYDEALLSMSYLRSAQNSLVGLEAIEEPPSAVAAPGADTPQDDRLDQRDSLLAAGFRKALPDIFGDLQVATDRAISPAGKRQTALIRQHLTDLRAKAGTLDRSALLAELHKIDDDFDVAVEIFAGDGFRFRREVGNIIDSSVRQTGLLIVGAVGLAVLISFLLTRAIVPPVNHAVAVARAIAAGRLDNEIPPEGHSETGQLMGALAAMQTSIAEKMERIRELMASQADGYRNRIAEQNTRFEAALNNMSQGLCMFDDAERLVVFNRRFIQMFGGIQLGVCAKDVLLDPGFQHVLMPGESASSSHELPDGRIVAVSREPIAGGGWVATFEDITERRRAERKLSHMALHDALTSLPNRVQFRERLETAIRKPAVAARTAVLCLDLDGFKSVNDTLGHPVGDRLLQVASDRLLATVGQNDLVARLGGDEFAIIQVASDPAAAAETLAKQVIEALSQPYRIDGNEASIGVSIGIILAMPVDGAQAPDVDTLIKNADLALYRAKHGGRSTFRFFEPQMDAQLQARRSLELDLRQAAERDELELYYQPFVDTRTRRVSGFEALMRWRHPERGFVPPADFIPVAEECGLIHTLGAWALETACRQAASWPDGMIVSVNLSPTQFRRSTLVADVERALSSAGLPASRLQLEITESLLLQETSAVLETLNRFRALGIRISMDDFGTGYSSLGYLSRFPFDKIKIDQSFVRNLEARDNLAIVRAVIGLSRAMDMSVIAEGVETREQAERLIREGCVEMQGYYFSRPRPASALAQIIKEVAAADGSRGAEEGPSLQPPITSIAV